MPAPVLCSSVYPPTNLQAIASQRQHIKAVSRRQQLAWFLANLERPTYHPDRYLILNVSGEAGIGKTWLLRKFGLLARSRQWLLTYTDRSCDRTLLELPALMASIAKQLQRQGYKLPRFAERYRTYAYMRQELSRAPDVPHDFFAVRGANCHQATHQVVSQRHQAQSLSHLQHVFTQTIDTDLFLQQAYDWNPYLAAKFDRHEDLRLFHQPLQTLTPLFIQDLQPILQQRAIVFFFDDSDQLTPNLETWLLAILAGDYGELPLNCLITIAGRQPLHQPGWSTYASLLAHWPLDRLSPTETDRYLQQGGQSVAKLISATLYKFTQGLPVWLALLASVLPQRTGVLALQQGTPGEQYLQWLLLQQPSKQSPSKQSPSKQLHRWALRVALPELITPEILPVLLDETELEQLPRLKQWLDQCPAIKRIPGGWQIQPLVRDQWLEQGRSQRNFAGADLHAKLAAYFDQKRQIVQATATSPWHDPTWQQLSLRWFYHWLCQDPGHHDQLGLRQILLALRQQQQLALAWAVQLQKAAQASRNESLSYWGEQLTQGFEAYQAQHYTTSLNSCNALIDHLEHPAKASAAVLEPELLAVAWTWRGELQRLLHAYDQALLDLNQALSLDPDYGLAIARRGLVYLITKRYQEANKDFEAALQRDPSLHWVAAVQRLAYRLSGHYHWVIADLNRVLTEKPQLVWALALRGDTYRLLDRHTLAVEDFTQALAVQPDYVWVLAHRGETYRVQQQYEQALADFDAAIADQPDYAFAIAKRGITYRQLEHYQAALSDLDQALTLQPDLSWALCARGELQLTQQRLPTALYDLNRAIELQPDYGLAIAYRGLVYRLQHQLEAALQDLGRAIRLKPGLNWVYAAQGEILLELGQPVAAIQSFDRALTVQPETRFAIAQRGIAHQALQEYAAALRDFNYVLELEPRLDWVLLARGEVYLALSAYTEALADFEATLALNPRQQQARLKRGVTYRYLQQPENAIADFNAILQQEPDSLLALLQRGEVYLWQKDFKAALADFKIVAETEPTFDRPFYVRSLAYQLMGYKRHAIANRKRALQIAEVICEHNEQTSTQNLTNIMNLALYHLVANNGEQTRYLYRAAIAQKPKEGTLRAAIRDLEDLIQLFPSNTWVKSMLVRLQHRAA